MDEYQTTLRLAVLIKTRRALMRTRVEGREARQSIGARVAQISREIEQLQRTLDLRGA
jgi:Trp operon repressor